MSFKPWLFLVLFALIGAVQTQKSPFSPPKDDLTDSEVIFLNNSDATEDRKACWEMGGVTYNREGPLNPGETRISALKKVKIGGNVTVYNFGSQFKSPHNKQSNEPTKWMVFNEDKSEWKGKQVGDHYYCQRILHYKCLNDMIINTTETLALANELKCSEFHGDLVLSGLGYSSEDYTLSKFNLDFIGSIEKIRGRLIITGLFSNYQLNFAKLNEVGKHQRNKTSLPILIDANSLLRVTFPNLSPENCFGGPSKECVHVGHNIDIGDIAALKTMTIVLKEGTIKEMNKYTEKEIDNENINKKPIPKEEKMKIHIDKDMHKRGWGEPEYDNWNDEAWGTKIEFRLIYIVLAVVSGVAIICLVGYACLKNRKRLRVDPEEIEKRDDQEFIEIDEDYFKVDNKNNNNNNKNSAMDDLGSL